MRLQPSRCLRLPCLFGCNLHCEEPVFRSCKQVFVPTIYYVIYPDWRKTQRDVERTICTEREGAVTLVAEVDGDVVGFLAYELDREEATGEVLLLAVHPASLYAHIRGSLTPSGPGETASAPCPRQRRQCTGVARATLRPSAAGSA